MYCCKNRRENKTKERHREIVAADGMKRKDQRKLVKTKSSMAKDPWGKEEVKPTRGGKRREEAHAQGQRKYEAHIWGQRRGEAHAWGQRRYKAHAGGKEGMKPTRGGQRKYEGQEP